MKAVNCTLQLESYESQCTNKRYNPAYELTFQDKEGTHTVTLQAGTRDQIYVYCHEENTVVLTVNPFLNYVGLEVFKHAELVGEIFAQFDYELKEYLNTDDVSKLSERVLAKRLYNHVEFF